MSDIFMPTSLDSWALTANTSSQSSALDSDFWDYINQNDITINGAGQTSDLAFEDFLSLMVTQLQSQTIDSAMDSSEMLNQLVQMSTVQAMTSLQESMNVMVEASTLTYAASLVGKTVTVGSYDENGVLQEVVGNVQGTGTYQGTSVIFVEGEMYALSDIMAIGTLPESMGTPDTDTSTDGNTDTETGDTADTETTI